MADEIYLDEDEEQAIDAVWSRVDALRSKPMNVPRDAAGDLMEALALAAERGQEDWYTALVMTALDQEDGDLSRAVQAANAAILEVPDDPEGGEDLGSIAGDLSRKASFFETCERDDAGHCLPGTGGGSEAKEKIKGKRAAKKEKPASKPEAKDAPAVAEKPVKEKAKPVKVPKPKKPKKAKAVRGEMAFATREGKGDDARVILADGSVAPPHITPGMVPPDWTDVQVSLDPNADLLVTAKDKKGNAKSVYSDSWEMRQDIIKFARTREGLEKYDEMFEQNQKARLDPKTKEKADCVWLMMEQGTRPGSEKDNKGVSQYFDNPVGPQDFTVDGDKITLQVGDETIPIKDKKTRAEIERRLQAGENEDMEDSTYWLKSYGATTLEGRHVTVDHNGDVRLKFVGKESVFHDHKIRNPELAKMLLDRKEKAGPRGKLFNTNDGQVGSYVDKLDGSAFTPKDLRTIRACKIAIDEVNKMDSPTDEKSYKDSVKRVGETVSRVLGNEAKQSLSTYIDPTIFSGWRANLPVPEKVDAVSAEG